jgi:farnesyl-diphosphate farnesyltransferase
MADYARTAYEGGGSILLTSIANYNRYCHYVGGIPGEGLFRSFSAFGDGGEQPCTGPQLEISNSAALFLQKLDLIRDYREDIDENRYLWPKEIWSRKQYGFSTMREMYEVVKADVDSERVQKAMYVQSEMVLDALRHATDMLDFLRMLKHPVVFDVCARLMCVSFAKLEMSFMNRKVFLGTVKLSKVESIRVSPFLASLCVSQCRTLFQIMMGAKTLREAAMIFCNYARKIEAKAHASDPNLFQISVACEKVCFGFIIIPPASESLPLNILSTLFTPSP